MAAEPTTLPAAASGTVALGDLTVNRMGFGAMRLTGPGVWGDPSDREGAKAVLRRTLELGVTMIDTASSYGPEVNETLIADALHPYPEDVVVATKGGLTRGGPGEWQRDGRPEYLRDALEGSLRRLRLERIDLYQLHAVDPQVPLEESVGELARLREQGKIRHLGLSNVDARQLAEARKIVPVVSVQNRYSLADRHSEAVLDVCEREGLAFLPWFPLALGQLAQAKGRLAQIAGSRASTAAQVALAWLLRRSPAMAPIPGTSSLEHLEENVASAQLELSDAEFSELSRAAVASL
ncbi:MAG: aldo/keto reductase [Actinobacteria bacterium]|nr:aldo/keto reductase [Actinomycetota bacterium]